MTTSVLVSSLRSIYNVLWLAMFYLLFLYLYLLFSTFCSKDMRQCERGKC